MDGHQLFQPLLSANTATAATTSSKTASSSSSKDDNVMVFSSNSSIILRLVTIISVSVISLWANYEASKGFDITIINDIKDTSASKRFTLLYISNDKAIRIIQNTSSTVETILYPNTNFTKKKVNHVTLHLVSTNQTNLVTVTTNPNHEFVISISPSTTMVGTNNHDSEITSMVLQGMTRVWLWDGNSMAPSWLLDGLVEYIKKAAGFADPRGFSKVLPDEVGHFCPGEMYSRHVAEFLDHSEQARKGFIQRLNQGLKDKWHDSVVEDALGMPAENVCNSFGNSSGY